MMLGQWTLERWTLGQTDIGTMLGRQDTGGPPITQKSLSRFSLPRFLAYVRASGGFSNLYETWYSPINTNFM